MALTPTPWIDRRDLIGGLLAAATAPHLAWAQAARVATPRQTEGPFSPRDWSGDADNDLVLVQGEAARARGTVVHVRGRVLTLTGEPVGGAGVEIWQCDAQGIYRHPADEDARRKRDPGFQGRGRVVTDAGGSYAFRTIRPVAYSSRTPHIHFKVQPPGGRALITQMYVFGEKLNAEDGVLNRIRDRRQRESVIVRLEGAERIEAGASLASFDIVLG